MPNNLNNLVPKMKSAGRTISRFTPAFPLLFAATTLLFLAAGCQTTDKKTESKAEMAAVSQAVDTAKATPPANSETIILHEGDTLSISFPGAPDLNTSTTIRRDGKITLKSLGEFHAAGLTPPQMEQELIKLYGAQLQTKEVSVAVTSSAFPIYVTGAVLRPGKILSDRPLSALEAIMEAGGFDYTKANMKAVRILRTENGHTERYIVNLKKFIQGQQGDHFSLRPSDIVYVPEKFTLF